MRTYRPQHRDYILMIRLVPECGEAAEPFEDTAYPLTIE
jgi:hypothetical protein